MNAYSAYDYAWRDWLLTSVTRLERGWMAVVKRNLTQTEIYAWGDTAENAIMEARRLATTLESASNV